jgi:prenyltransferase beta subunit
MNEQINIGEIISARELLEQKLLAKRNDQGVWDGRLSSSALSTSVAVFGLHKYNSKRNKATIDKGLQWLNANVNDDGGFGDTIKSSSNLSTTLLCWSALSIVVENQEYYPLINKVEGWLKQQLGILEPENISKSVLKHYSTDKTFSVPILAMCTLAGRLGTEGWKYVPQLPFQFAVFPDKVFKWLNLSVVSYAIPALIAMGLAKQHNDRIKKPFTGRINKWVITRVLRVLSEKQPTNGGFLEATPLTGFVLMSLVGAGQQNHNVCNKAENFLRASIRDDGSWPIDTSLTTWVSTLSVNALGEDTLANLDKKWLSGIYKWLNKQQHRNIHQFTKSKPGGWAWIDLEGGVPDGDDTSGALLALQKLSKLIEVDMDGVSMGVKWLIDNQNADGGFPTFCRGWGKLPFDASCADITSHAIRALLYWENNLDSQLSKKAKISIGKAIKFLRKRQRSDGSWLPLWFGNENEPNHQNPVYGTSLVLIGLMEARKHGISKIDDNISSGIAFLKNAQNQDGGWGANGGVDSSIEESSLAIRAMVLNKVDESTVLGSRYLLHQISKYKESEIPAEPIGLYFASLWYYEELYPLTFACTTLNVIIEELQKE